MRKTLWNPSSREELVTRVNHLKPDATPRWGKMNAPQMLTHLVGWMALANGELSARPRDMFFRHTPLKQLAIFWLPFPKGVPTAPELIALEPGDWDIERGVLCRHIESWGNFDKNRQWPEHPAFGKLTSEAWGVLGYRHTDHHLNQFGV